MTTLETAAVGQNHYASLEGMRAAHAVLLEQIPNEGLNEEQAARVVEFLEKGAKTGTLLDNPEDRKAAQGLLDYWRATLYSESRSRGTENVAGESGQRVASAILAPFDADTVDSLAQKAEETVRSLSPEEQERARRLLLRLVRLVPDRRAFAPEPASRAALEQIGDPVRMGQVLDRLVQVGVLRVERAGSGEERYALAYEALTRSWDRLRIWLEQRLRFRDTVQYWDKHSRNPGALIDDVLLDEAREYHDKSDLENAFVKASRQLEKRQTRNYRLLMIAFAVLAAVAVGLAVLAWIGWANATREEKALKARVDVREMRGLARTMAEFGAGSPVQQTLARQRLTWALARSKEEPDRFRILNDNEDQLEKAIQQNPNSDEVLQWAQKIARESRHKVFATKDKDLKAEFELQRALSYDQTRFIAAQIVKTLPKSYLEAGGYIGEFRILRWGEIPLFAQENSAVDRAVQAFGHRLDELMTQQDKTLPEVVKKKFKPWEKGYQAVCRLTNDPTVQGKDRTDVLSMKASKTEIEKLQSALEDLKAALHDELEHEPGDEN